MSPARWFICPDKDRILIADCLKEGGCRMSERCATRSFLRLAAAERPWTGKPSTTQLIQGTLCAFLKLTKDYAVSPDQRAFMINGSRAHANLETSDAELSFLEEKLQDGTNTGITDVIECEAGEIILADYKTSGSYKVARALGFYVDEEPTGELFKSGPREGQPKTRKILKRDLAKADRWEWTLQLNDYRIQLEPSLWRKVDHLKIQCIVRDGGTHIARSRGIFRNIYYFDIDILPDRMVKEYFETKKSALVAALEAGHCDTICNAKENWDGVKCARYCEVAEFCPFGKYLKREQEEEDMPIKGLSEVRQFPRLGKIRLGIKKKTAAGKEYPSEVDYFILDPSTPVESERKLLIDEFQKIYGAQPKSIDIMLPVSDIDQVFPQSYKRYGSGTMLQCVGDGETATAMSKDFATGLEIIEDNGKGLVQVRCLGTDCPYYKDKHCARVGVLQVLLQKLPGIGVWQIVTTSVASIKNINSCIDTYIRACGRAHMIPMTLVRKPTPIAHEGKKTTHYILHIDTDIRISELQKLATIDPTRVLLALPPADVEKEDIHFLENRQVNEPAPVPVEHVDEGTGVITETTLGGITEDQKKELRKLYKAGAWTKDGWTHMLINRFECTSIDVMKQDEAKRLIASLLSGEIQGHF